MTDASRSVMTNEEQILKDRFEQLMGNEEVITNLLVSRMEWMNSAINPQRNINKECGYPELLGAELYRNLYDRDAISARVVEVMPKESWQVTPSLYEDEDADSETEFEAAWKGLHKTLRGKSWYQDEEGSPIWSYLLRVDILSGIGRYGCLLIGVDDGKELREPLKGFEDVDSQIFGRGTEGQYGANPLYPFTQGYDEFTTQLIESQDKRLDKEPVKAQTSEKKDSKTSLLYLKVFDETLAQITMYERDPRNPRFGLPVMYLVTFNDPKFGGQSGIGLAVATQHVHWSRIIHVAEGLSSSDVFAYPRMQQPYNRIFDLCKVYGSSGEGFWQQAFAILSMETHPQLGGDVKIDQRGIDQQMTNLRTRLKRHLVTAGMTTKTLAPAVSDPTAYKDAFIEAICIYLGCPVRVFKGSERGELASSQDDSSWNDRLRHRQTMYLTPRVIVPFIDRLIQIGVLPEPEGYSVCWPDLDSLSEKDKAGISQTRTAAMQSYVGGNVEAIMDPMNFLTKIMGFDQEEANEIVESQQEHLEEQQAEQADFAEQGLDENGLPQKEEAVQPVKVREGESLVHPQTGETVAEGAPIPVKNEDDSEWQDGEWVDNSNPEGINQYTKHSLVPNPELTMGRPGYSGFDVVHTEGHHLGTIYQEDTVKHRYGSSGKVVMGSSSKKTWTAKVKSQTGGKPAIARGLSKETAVAHIYKEHGMITDNSNPEGHNQYDGGNGIGGYAKSHGAGKRREATETQKDKSEQLRLKKLHQSWAASWVKTGKQGSFLDFVKGVDPVNYKAIKAIEESKQ